EANREASRKGFGHGSRVQARSQGPQKAEDFLSRQPDGVSGISIDAIMIRHKVGAADAAKSLGIDVVVDPLTERPLTATSAPESDADKAVADTTSEQDRL